MCIFKSFECAQAAGFVSEGNLPLVPGEVGLLNSDRLDVDVVGEGDAVWIQGITGIASRYCGQFVRDEVED